MDRTLAFAGALGALVVICTGCLPPAPPEVGSSTTAGPGPGVAGGGNAGTVGNAGNSASGLPCDLQGFLATKCQGCHATPPRSGAPMPLVTAADLSAPAKSDPSRTVAQMVLARIQDQARPMPPAPAARATAAEIGAVQAWLLGTSNAPSCSPAGPGASTGSGGNAGIGRGGSGGANAGSGGSGGANAGSGGSGGANAGSGGSGGSTGPTIAGGMDLPCDLQALFAARCTGCHGTRPSGGAPMSLVTYADLTAPAVSDRTRTVAQLAAARIQDNAYPMPPPPSARVPSGDIAALTAWIAAGYPRAAGCGGAGGGGGGSGGRGGSGGSGATGADGGVSADAGSTPGPFDTPPVCTSGQTWSGGKGSPLMNPGLACINCHRQEQEAPAFTIAGTVYPTAHEPDRCNGANGTNGARVLISTAAGQTITLTPNAAGNFYYNGVVATPFRAVVAYMGRERAMGPAQTSGDCNGCHTQNGANGAPGRILLP